MRLGQHNDRFREVQHVSQWWVWAIVGGIALTGWWAFIEQIVMGRPWGNRPAPDAMVVLIWLVFGLGLPVVTMWMRLIIRVSGDTLHVRYVPFRKRDIPLSEIAVAESKRYHPMRDYLGWGIRWMPRKGWVYSISGDRGVQLVFTNGRKLLLGSRKPIQLAEAIHTAGTHGNHADPSPEEA